MISLTRDDDYGPPLERCCFCRRRTRYWTCLPDRADGEQVACCQACAINANRRDVPSKDTWCRRELISTGREP